MKANVRWMLVYSFAVLVTAPVVLNSAALAADIDPEELIRDVETQYQGKSAYAVATMEIVTDAWQREMRMEMWSQGRDKFLAVIKAPKKDAGTATLRVEDEMWNYLPKIDRLMKIPASLMGDSWMGSNLTNDDLVREVKVEELYTLSVEETKDNIVTIKAVPKKDSAVVWGKVLYQVDKDKRVPEQVEYFDEDGEKIRTIKFDQVEKVGGQWVAKRMQVLPEDAPDEKTVLTYQTLELNADVPDSKFSVRNLRRR